MQLEPLKERLSPGAMRRRAAKMARRRLAGHAPPMLHGIPVEPRRRVKREHHTMRSLAAKAYGRGRMYLGRSLGPDIPATVFDVVNRAVERPSYSAPSSWRDRLRGWRNKAAQVFQMKRGQ